MQTGEQRFALIAMELTVGEVVWRRDDLATPPWSHVPFRVVDGSVPLAIEYPQPGVPNEPRSRCGFAFVDVETGATRDMIPDIVPARSRARINGDVGVWPDTVVIGTGTSIQAFRRVSGLPGTLEQPKREDEQRLITP
jgi:hypothetical protein